MYMNKVATELCTLVLTAVVGGCFAFAEIEAAVVKLAAVVNVVDVGYDGLTIANG